MKKKIKAKRKEKKAMARWERWRRQLVIERLTMDQKVASVDENGNFTYKRLSLAPREG